MDVMDDIHDRLNETERRAGEIVSRLEQLDSLQRSFADAGRGLEEANANVTSLVAATRTVVESLNETLLAFRDAVEVIQRSDPAEVRGSLARIEAEIGRINTKLAVVDDLASELRTTRKTIAQTAQSSERETKKVVEDAVERLSQQTVRVAEDAVERLSRQTVFDRVFGRYRST